MNESCLLETPVSVWKLELLSHPEYFRIENDELFYLGFKVVLIGSAQEKDEFQTMVNKILKENNNELN